MIAGNFGPPLGDLIAKARDFFTVSELRDLVFHVREHRMTIPQIANFLRDNKLQFLGFELDPESAHNYRVRFPARPHHDESPKRPHTFETAHPETFHYTYQFWVRAP